MLAYNQEGKLCLEDADGSVVLDFSTLVRMPKSRYEWKQTLIPFQDEPGDGLFSEGCFALVEGEYTEEATLEIIAIGQPPCEARETSRYVYRRWTFQSTDFPKGQYMAT